jgi:RimJ/RimL family protein N-acetyltransferase
MPPPIVSFVTFNKMGSVVKSLNSLLAASDDFELYIVDNDSRDFTWDYIQSLTDSRIKMIKRFERNEGVINALNWVIVHRLPDQDYVNFEPDVYNFNREFVQTFRDVGMEFNAGLVHACTHAHRNDLVDHLVVSEGGYGFYPSTYPQCTAGLFFWIPSDVMNAIGHYCEASYLADIDLNARITHGLKRAAGYTPHVQCIVIHPTCTMGVGGYNCKECHLHQSICHDTQLLCNDVYPGAADNTNRLHYRFNKDSRSARERVLRDRLSGKLHLYCNTHHSQSLEDWEERMRCQNADFFASSYEQHQLNRKAKENPMPITLRPVQKSDALNLMSLRNAPDTYSWFYSNRQFTLQEVENWITNLDPNKDIVLMAEEDNVLIGTASIYNIENQSAEVGRIIVSENIRGKGIGTSILLLLPAIAKEKDITLLYANIKTDNIRSYKAFEKAGYIRITTKPETGYYYEKKI